MTRRDIIIVAVLVNAGLLAILFMMAITSDNDKVIESNEFITISEDIKPTEPLLNNSSSESLIMPVEEVDFPIEPSNSNPVIIDEDNALDFEQDDELPPPAAEPVAPKPQDVDMDSIETSKKIVSATKFVDITVKRGDSLDKIARVNGTTIKAIKQANDLKTDRLDIGQVLRVPVSTDKKNTSKTTTSKKADKQIAHNDAEYYTIKSGDNPWKIAKQFKIKVDDFLKLNDLNEDKARNLKIGDKVRVR